MGIYLQQQGGVEQLAFPEPGHMVKADNIGNKICYTAVMSAAGLVLGDVINLDEHQRAIVEGKTVSMLVDDNSMTGSMTGSKVAYFLCPDTQRFAACREPVQSKTSKTNNNLEDKEVMLKIGDELEAKMVKTTQSKHRSQHVLKICAQNLVQSSNGFLEMLPEGKENLMKVLSCKGVEVSLILAKRSIPNRTTCVGFFLVASVPRVIDGEQEKVCVHLFSSKPTTGQPLDLLHDKLLGQGFGAKDLCQANLWGPDAEVALGMLGPIIQFAWNLNNKIMGKDVPMDEFLDPSDDVMTKLCELYRSQREEAFSKLLSSVKTYMPDWGSHGGSPVFSTDDDCEVEDCEDEDEDCEVCNEGGPRASRRASPRASPRKRARSSPVRQDEETSEEDSEDEEGEDEGMDELSDDEYQP